MAELNQAEQTIETDQFQTNDDSNFNQPLTLHSPRRCEFGAGWSWFIKGFSLLKNNIIMSILVLIVYGVIMLILGLIPFVNIISVFIGPAFAGGFMVIAHRINTEGVIDFSDLFAGIQQHFWTFVLLSVLYFLSIMVVVFIVTVLSMGIGGLNITDLANADPNDPTLFIAGMGIYLVGGFILFIPIIMSIWFAPALIMFHGQSAFSSMKQSLSGSMKNIFPLFVFWVLTTIALIISSVPFGLGLLFTTPAFIYSIYASYRDIFVDRI